MIISDNSVSYQNTQRLFFALYPPLTIRQQLATTSAMRHVSGKPTSLQNLHITLVFLGETTLEKKTLVLAAAQSIEVPRFELNLSQFGYWAKSRIFWLGPTHTPHALHDLVTNLNSCLQQQCGYQPEKRPYQAHITLVRNASPPRGIFSFEPLSWSVNEFYLMRSIPHPKGVQYLVEKMWHLSP